MSKVLWSSSEEESQTSFSTPYDLEKNSFIQSTLRIIQGLHSLSLHSITWISMIVLPVRHPSLAKQVPNRFSIPKGQLNAIEPPS